MIKVTVMNNMKRDVVIVEKSSTLRSVFEEAGIDFSRGTATLDGAPLEPGALNNTLESYGYTDEEGRNKCFLMSVVKADNA